MHKSEQILKIQNFIYSQITIRVRNLFWQFSCSVAELPHQFSWVVLVLDFQDFIGMFQRKIFQFLATLFFKGVRSLLNVRLGLFSSSESESKLSKSGSLSGSPKVAVTIWKQISAEYFRLINYITIEQFICGLSCISYLLQWPK